MDEYQDTAPVGAIVWSAFAREHYTVLTRNNDGSVTVRWLGDGPGEPPLQSRVRTLHMELDTADRIVGIRERLMIHSRNHRVALVNRLGAPA